MKEILPTNFQNLKNKADKIKDLNKRELFLAEHLTRYKQEQHDGDIIQQITDEISLTQLQKLLSNTESITDQETKIVDKIEDTTDIPCIKVRTAVILEILREMNAGTAHNDRSKISRLIAFLTGNSNNHIYNEIRKGITFTDYHTQEINHINKILTDLNLSININQNKNY